MRSDLYDKIAEKVNEVRAELRAALADKTLTVAEITTLAEIVRGLPTTREEKQALVVESATRLYDEEIVQGDIKAIPGRGENPDGLPEGWEGAVDEFLRGTIKPAVALFFKILPKGE